MIRTFIAVFPPPEVSEEIGRGVRRFFSVAPDAKWVKPENLHFTLRFLGDVSEERLDLLIDCVAESVLEVAPFDLTVSGLGAFPSAKRPRVLWVGAAAGGDALVKLAKLVESGLRRKRFGKADKPFSPHLTLARWRRSIRDDAVAGFIDSGSLEVGPFNVREVHVMESKLGPRGPAYTSRAACLLGG